MAEARSCLGLAVAGLMLVASSLPTAAAELTNTPPEPQSQAAFANSSLRWEKSIRAFEEEDRTNPPPKGAILFVGSSSIRMWKDLAQDFPRYPVLSRGFGGSQIADSLFYADRIILPYEPKVVLLYAGDNDLAAGKTPETVFADFEALVTRIHSRLPETRIAYIAIKPSLSRRHLMDRIRRANELIQGFARQRRRVTFLDVFTPMLDESGEPRPTLLLKDGLHMNRAGYDIWAAAIQPYLHWVTSPRPPPGPRRPPGPGPPRGQKPFPKPPPPPPGGNVAP